MDKDEISTKDEENYIKTIGKIFTKIPIKERYKGDEKINVMDEANIVMVTPKSDDGNEILKIFKHQDNNTKEPELQHKNIGKVKFSTEYLKNIIEVFCVGNIGSVNITTSEDFPGVFENQHFKFILAPKVEY